MFFASPKSILSSILLLVSSSLLLLSSSFLLFSSSLGLSGLLSAFLVECGGVGAAGGGGKKEGEGERMVCVIILLALSSSSPPSPSSSSPSIPSVSSSNISLAIHPRRGLPLSSLPIVGDNMVLAPYVEKNKKKQKKEDGMWGGKMRETERGKKFEGQ